MWLEVSLDSRTRLQDTTSSSGASNVASMKGEKSGHYLGTSTNYTTQEGGGVPTSMMVVHTLVW